MAQKDLALSFRKYIVLVRWLSIEELHIGTKKVLEKVCHRASLGAYLQMVKLVARTEARFTEFRFRAFRGLDWFPIRQLQNSDILVGLAFHRQPRTAGEHRPYRVL